MERHGEESCPRVSAGDRRMAGRARTFWLLRTPGLWFNSAHNGRQAIQCPSRFRPDDGLYAPVLGLIVLLPVAGLFLRLAEVSFAEFWRMATTERALAAYRLTFGASFVAASVNAVFGTLVAWVLVRYQFPGKRLFDALVDFPFALPTAVAGLTLANLYAETGWLGRFLVPLGFRAPSPRLGW
jgi:sulfate/thiosulfate transport system permease protein